MASNIKVSLVLSDNGTIELTTRSANKLKKELDAIGASAAQTSKALNTAKMRTEGMGGIQENIEYRNARGAAGAAGGGSRDFAKQAQGLGGLVHLYATFAANIFAVSTAFTALDNAFANERMTKAAESIGSTLGINVKVLSTDLQKATDYAISFQDALKFSNTGIAAGLTGSQIKNLTVIAKGAANALGRDMNDSIDRVIRGTAKMEQEILDELGIFVRANDAYKAYAQKIGLSDASLLTSSQKVLAYADAVEKSGEKWKKFAEIEDPFSKFTSNLREAGQEILSLINAGLTPLLSILSQSKSVLEGIILLITTKLVKLALPAGATVIKNLFMVDPAEALAKAQTSYSNYISKQEKNIEKLKSQKQDIITSLNLKDKLGTVLPTPLATSLNTQLSFQKVTAGVLDPSTTAGQERFEKLMNSSLATRMGAISKIKDEAKRNEEIAKLTSLEYVKQETTTGKLIVDIEKLKTIHLQTYDILLAENTAMLEKEALSATLLLQQKELNNLKEKETGIDSLNIKVKNAAVLNAGIKDISEIAANKGIGPVQKLKEVWSTSAETISKTTGIIATGFAGVRIAGAALAAGLEALMGPIGWILLAWSAWDLAIKPLLYTFGVFSKDLDELQDSIDRFAELNKTSTDALKENTVELGYNGIALDNLNTKYTLAKRLLQEGDSARSEIMKAYTKGIQNLTGFEEFLGKDKEVARKYVRELYTDIENQIKLFTTQGDTQTASGLEFIKSKVGQLTSASREYIEQELPRLIQAEQTLIDQGGKGINAGALNVEKVNGYAKAASDSLIKFSDDVYRTNDVFAKTLKNNDVQNFYVNTSKLVDEIVAGNTDAIGGVQALIDKLPEQVKQKLPDFIEAFGSLKKSVVSGTNELLPDFAPKLKGFGSLIQSLQTGASTIDRQIQSGPGKDGLARANAILMDSYNNQLAAKQQLIDLDNYEIQKYEKLHGAGNIILIQDRERAEIKKAEIEYDKQIAEAKEKLRVANKEDNTPQQIRQNLENNKAANEAALKTKDLAILQSKEKSKQEQIVSKIKLYENTIYVDAKNALELDKDKLDLLKAQNKLTESESSARQYILDLNQNTLDINKVLEEAKLQGLTNEAQMHGTIYEYQLRQLNLQKQHIINQKEITDETRKEVLLRQGLENTYDALSSILSMQENQGIISLELLKKQHEARLAILKNEERGKEGSELQKVILQEINAEYEYQLKMLNDRKRIFEKLSTENKIGAISDEAYRRAIEFTKNMRDGVTGTFDAIYSGMDAAIDELTTKMMKNEKISLKDLITTFRNTAAEEFRKMSADLMKSAARTAISKGIEFITGKPSDLRSVEEKQLSALEQIVNNTSMMASGISSGTGYSTGYSNAPDTSEMSIEDATKANEAYYGALEQATVSTDTLSNKVPDFISKIGGSFGGLFGPGGLLMGLIGQLGKGIGGILGPILNLFGIGGGVGGATAGFGGGNLGGFDLGSLGSLFSSDSIGSAIGSAMGMEGFGGWLSGLFFANGGIMTDRGALSLNKYSTGGIANRPQLAMYGEGRQPEAYVPLPDGKTIPVTMQGRNGGGEVSVNINITDNSTTSDVSASNGAKDYAAMAKIISSKVKEELIQQKRPGGILY